LADIYDNETYEPRRGVGYLMHRVRTEMLSGMDKEFAGDEELAAMEVSSAQFIILAQLAVGGRKSASELCKGMSYDAGAMTRMVDRLEDKGLLTRKRCPDDRRLVYLELTQKGDAAYRRMRAISLRVQNRFLHGFTHAEARELEGYLIRMLDNTPAAA
jgi:MarR family transcriptional regulator, multiple antibiotic resistance protein MarR